MSDTTALSHEYTTNADFAKQVNLALLTLKKAFMELPEGIARPEAAEVERARASLAMVLSALIARFDQGEAEDALLTFPEEVYRRVEAKRDSQIAWFIQDLKEARDTLRAGEAPQDKHWQTLEEVADAADATASAAFRRLWRL